MTDKRKPRRQLTDDEIGRMLQTFDGVMGPRNKALFCLLTLTPLRVHECLTLQTFDVYDGEHVRNHFKIIRETKKTKREVIIPIPTDLAEFLLPICKDRKPESILLQADKKLTKKQITRNWAWSIIKTAAQKAGIDSTLVSPQSCKKTYRQKLEELAKEESLEPSPKKTKLNGENHD